MKAFHEVIEEFTEKEGWYSFRFGPDNRYELTVEPLLFGQWHIGLYENGELILPDKIPVRPGGSDRFAIPDAGGDQDAGGGDGH